MAVKNQRSEKERMFASVKTLLKAGENKLQALVQVVGNREDEAMQRIYTAFLITENDANIHGSNV